VSDENGQGANPNPTPEQHPEGTLNSPRSRRNFLRTAAISAAGVAGVSGAVGVAAASGKLSPNTLKHFTGGPQTLSATTPPSIDGFFEETDPGPCLDTTKSSYSSGHTNRYVVFYISNLPKGNYSFDVTQSCDGNTAGPIRSHALGGTATLQWEYKTDSSQVHVVFYDANTEPACPTDISGKKSVAYNSFTASWVTSTYNAATYDVAIFAHIIDNQSTLASTTKFTGTLSGDKNLTFDVNVHS
jgi:hypothetical protein